MPLQREAMAELLADLLLDHDLIDAQVELVLPMARHRNQLLVGTSRCRFEKSVLTVL